VPWYVFTKMEERTEHKPDMERSFFVHQKRNGRLSAWPTPGRTRVLLPGAEGRLKRLDMAQNLCWINTFE
jgi:hypothetical protein